MIELCVALKRRTKCTRFLPLSSIGVVFVVVLYLLTFSCTSEIFVERRPHPPALVPFDHPFLLGVASVELFLQHSNDAETGELGPK